jgi:putative oxidoreductase
MTAITPTSRSATAGEPRPIIPPLAGFYSHARDLSWLVVRLTAGGMLLVHGIMKVMPMAEKGFTATIEAFAAGSMARRGIDVVFFLETIGAVMIILGLFTRFIAAALAVEFAIITFVAHWPQGFTWSRGGWEYPLFWGLIMFAIALRGGGPYSLDRSGHSFRPLVPEEPGYSAAARTFWACAACFERRHKPPMTTTRTAPTKAAASSM